MKTSKISKNLNLNINIPIVEDINLKERNKLLTIQNINLNKGIYICHKFNTNEFYVCRTDNLNLILLNNNSECLLNICKIFNLFYDKNYLNLTLNNIKTFAIENKYLFRL